MNDRLARRSESFLENYQPSELRIASEFLKDWLPFLSEGLCRKCTRTLSKRIQTVDPGDGEPEPELDLSSTSNGLESHDHGGNIDTHFHGSWKDGAEDMNSPGSCNNGSNGFSEPGPNTSTSEAVSEPQSVDSRPVRISWADMAQEEDDELDEEEDGVHRHFSEKRPTNGNVGTVLKVQRKPLLPREQREYIRFMNVQRKKDFICLERVNGKIVNILDGLELHTGIFSAAEQKRIVDLVYVLQEKGKNGELRPHTYTAPHKWMRGKGRVTIQFGCCYNYAIDKDGNPPGILKHEIVDPIPHLFKVIIRRLVSWHVLPPSCVPDSCIVNIYDEGDCIPPHIDNHDFLRPFCTVSFLSECSILFGANLKIMAPGEFSGPIAILLPVGSVLVLNGKGADVAKHCVPAVPTKRISITFRKMDETKRPHWFHPEVDLQGLQPLPYEVEDELKKPNSPKPESQGNMQAVGSSRSRTHRGRSNKQILSG